MMNCLRRIEVILVLFLAVLVCACPAAAFHSGSTAECKECHEGTGAALRGSDPGSTCLRCHQAPPGVRKPAGHYVASNDVDLRTGMPPSQLTPGGDFGYLKKNYSWQTSGSQQESSPGDRHGHNIIAADYGYEADTKNITTPSGVYPGAKLSCRVEGGSIVLTPEQSSQEPPQLITDSETGLRITQSPAGTKVTSEDVRAAMADFP